MLPEGKAKPMLFRQESFVSLEFQAIAAKINSDNRNYRNMIYAETQRGKIDIAMLFIVLIAKAHWSKSPNEPITVEQIKRNFVMHSEWIPDALFKLRDMGMIKLALKNAVVGQGDNWIENETACEDGQTVAA